METPDPSFQYFHFFTLSCILAEIADKGKVLIWSWLRVRQTEISYEQCVVIGYIPWCSLISAGC